MIHNAQAKHLVDTHIQTEEGKVSHVCVYKRCHVCVSCLCVSCVCVCVCVSHRRVTVQALRRQLPGPLCRKGTGWATQGVCCAHTHTHTNARRDTQHVFPHTARTYVVLRVTDCTSGTALFTTLHRLFCRCVCVCVCLCVCVCPHSSIPRRPNWVERVTAPIMFGVKELMPTLAKLGSAITVSVRICVLACYVGQHWLS